MSRLALCDGTYFTGKSRGYGFVRFKMLEDQIRCLAKQHFIEGKQLEVKLSQSKSADLDKSPLEKVCIFCSLSFSDLTLRRHMFEELKIYTGKTLCPECAVDCLYPDKMIDHVFLVHGELKKFVCSFENCSEAFWFRDKLLAHERYAHC